MRNSAVKRIQFISCLILPILAVLGCQKKAAPPATAGMQGLPVQTAAVTLAPVAQSSEYVATIKSRRSASILPQVNGLLTQILVHSGDRVKAGQTLMEIDPRQQQATVNAQRATEQQKKALYDYTTVEVERQHKLFDAGVTSRDTYEQAQQAFQNAKADYESAVELRKTQEEQLAYYTIRAPFDGVVTKKWADVGDFATPGKPLIAIEDPSALQLEADVPEAIASHIQHDLRLTARVDGVSGELTGTVSEIAPAADSISRTFRVKVDFSDQPGLSSGQFARLLVPVGESNSLRVPVSAVVQRGQLEIVFAVANQHAQLHLVKTGKPFGDETEILSGLHAGGAVVVEGATQLTDGQTVEAK